jgi:hypothetical protein
MKYIRRLVRRLKGEDRRNLLTSDVALLVSLGDSSLALDLGSGPVPNSLFGASRCVGIDVYENELADVMKSDLTLSPIPFASMSVDVVTAFDFVEHVPRWKRFEGIV